MSGTGATNDRSDRCVTVHGTNSLRVENNVTYNTVGHCVFLEDGIEHGHEYVHNLAIQTKCHTSKPCVPTNLAARGETRNGTNGQQSKGVLLPSDNTAASFWITNRDNVYRNNVAAGSDSNGFWMSLPEHPNGKFEGSEISAKTWPRRTPFRRRLDFPDQLYISLGYRLVGDTAVLPPPPNPFVGTRPPWG